MTDTGRASTWRTEASTIVHTTPYFTVVRDDALRPDGQKTAYHHVQSPGAAVVLAVDSEGHVVVTEQWIYTHGDTQFRLPSGGIDHKDHGSPQAAAERELLAETGLRATRWEALGTVNGADSLSNHVDHLFVATGLIEPATPVVLEGDEADLRVHRMPARQVLQLIEDGVMPHAGSQAAVYRLIMRNLPSDVVSQTCSSLAAG